MGAYSNPSTESVSRAPRNFGEHLEANMVEGLTEQTKASAEAAANDALRIANDGINTLGTAIRNNPTLALAGFAALGAIVALAVVPNRTPRSGIKRLQRDLARQTRDIRRTVREEVRASGIESKISGLGSTLSAVEWQPYVKPFLDQAVAFADEAKQRLARATK